MGVGAVAAWNIASRVPDLNLLVVFVLAGLITAVVGMVFGLPSMRIKGFYLAVATLAAQFFLPWLFVKIGRSEEHTSELQSLMRISYAVFCLKKKTQKNYNTRQSTTIKITP